MPVEAYTAVKVKPPKAPKFKGSFPQLNNVVEVLYVTGPFDFLLRIVADNTFELSKVLEEIRSDEDVVETVTFIVLERLK
ncbi:MAG TPA: Lrp/AsnC family transcriptional regulator [Candidatus Korarchaeota archaeon]|nr:Lrp/AsnC family transcriptional regulator [Candidatus Korarchaeota archaeon]